jgi:hypothetical protein
MPLVNAPLDARHVRLDLVHVEHAKDRVAYPDAVTVGAAHQLRDRLPPGLAGQVQDGDLDPFEEGAAAWKPLAGRAGDRAVVHRVPADEDVGDAVAGVLQVELDVAVPQVGHLAEADQTLVGGQLHDHMGRQRAGLAAGVYGRQTDIGDLHGQTTPLQWGIGETQTGECTPIIRRGLWSCKGDSRPSLGRVRVRISGGQIGGHLVPDGDGLDGCAAGVGARRYPAAGGVAGRGAALGSYLELLTPGCPPCPGRAERV